MGCKLLPGNDMGLFDGRPLPTAEIRPRLRWPMGLSLTIEADPAREPRLCVEKPTILAGRTGSDD